MSDEALALVRSSRGVFYRIVHGDIEPMGQVDFITNTITIRRDLTFDSFVRTVWHEVIHAELRESGDFLPKKLDEAATVALSYSLPELLSENLHLLRMEDWWSGREEDDFPPDGPPHLRLIVGGGEGSA